MVLFDIRSDDSHAGFIALVNRGLDSEPGNLYLSRFGYVCSSRWWECFDRGEIPVKLLSGEVNLVGVRLDNFDEEEDVVEFASDGKLISHDRTGPWAVFPIRIGDRVVVLQVVAEMHSRTGPECYVIEVRAEWFPGIVAS